MMFIGIDLISSFSNKHHFKSYVYTYSIENEQIFVVRTLDIYLNRYIDYNTTENMLNEQLKNTTYTNLYRDDVYLNQFHYMDEHDIHCTIDVNITESSKDIYDNDK